MKLEIRPVGPAEATLLAELHAQAAADRPWSAVEYAALLHRADVRTTLALDGQGRPMGFALASLAAGEAELYEIAVAPPWRRRGIARRLLADLLAHLQTRRIAALHLEVAEDNLAARGLYAALGFVETGRRRDYYTHGATPVDALTMSKTLSA